ncbi:uncharacterized protein A1O9_10054 [Exophiala aquamarina CBS 119918]|uniref:Uncharacterized protein n=1 Tax=Exophiala aquamarina CBS 119918 TaxID=1182545 RepID=A0A072P0I9_9EURO|nr:uncharacterized protein A1O9_10054 [Exophiala aquamarina CBS 119918]KEF53654.1 hypothetical protein A1O9_10054 [Exophiala aquamarina CBS 119918]
MSTPIQAQSISSLTDLLANPPRYPRNPTHQVHDPLVLYIVRVPGSQDVFLTPLKPPTKASISIDAVQSSLYFLHVERPEDDELRKSFEAAKAAENRPYGVAGIQRKPLPNTPYANYPASQRPPTPPKSYPHYQPPSVGSQDETQADRYSNRGNRLRLNTSDPSKPPISRKPIGARSMMGNAYSGNSSSLAGLENMDSASPEDNGLGRTELPRKPVLTPAMASGTDLRNQSPNRSSPVRSSHGPFPELPLDALRITLIRRDPASGNQWNVGNIVLPSTSTRETPLQHFEMELISPGYGRFAQNEGTAGRPFQRKTGYMLVPNSESTPGGRKRSNSTELFSTAASAATRKPRQAYSFLSPWQGMCSFSNGIDGRSLRCRHMLSAANSGMPALAADVAELRFNLPWAKLRSKDMSRHYNDSLNPPINVPAQPSMSKDHHQWRRSLQSFTHKAREQLSKHDVTDGRPSFDASGGGFHNDARGNSQDEERMNLDLGREKAGGGFKGHSAKLGKLIIEDEGLKMCDLVVAACMGVWWQHYSGDLAG